MYPTVRENPFTCSEYVDYCTVGLFYLVPFVEGKFFSCLPFPSLSFTYVVHKQFI